MRLRTYDSRNAGSVDDGPGLVWLLRPGGAGDRSSPSIRNSLQNMIKIKF